MADKIEWEKAVEEFFLPKNTKLDLEVHDGTKTFSGVNKPPYVKGESKYDGEIYRFSLELHPELKTFSVVNATHVTIKDGEGNGLVHFLREHSDIFETLERAISSRECYLAIDRTIPIYSGKMRDVFYGHNVDDKKVFYKYGDGSPTEYAFEAHMTSGEGREYFLNSMSLRYALVPPFKSIEIPEFPDPNQSIIESSYQLMGRNKDYRSIKMEEILLFTPSREYELAQIHMMELGLNGPTATLILNKEGIVDLRQHIAFKGEQENQ